MAKKIILYPVAHQTRYWDEEKTKVRDVKGTLYAHSYTVPSEPEVWEDQNIEWVENRVFPDTLTFTGYGRGRSSAVMYFEGSDGAEYNMFLTDTETLLKTKDIINGKVTANWTYCKRGANYGIRLAKDEEVISFNRRV